MVGRRMKKYQAWAVKYIDGSLDALIVYVEGNEYVHDGWTIKADSLLEAVCEYLSEEHNIVTLTVFEVMPDHHNRRLLRVELFDKFID